MKQDAANRSTIAKPPLLKIFSIQCVVLLLLSITSLYLVNITMANSVFLGGLISIVPSAYFSRWAFRYSGAQSAGNIARSFYRGEAGKFVLTIVMFAGVFAWVKPLNVVVLFLVYIFMMVLNWVLTLRVSKRR